MNERNQRIKQRENERKIDINVYTYIYICEWATHSSVWSIHVTHIQKVSNEFLLCTRIMLRVLAKGICVYIFFLWMNEWMNDAVFGKHLFLYSHISKHFDMIVNRIVSIEEEKKSRTVCKSVVYVKITAVFRRTWFRPKWLIIYWISKWEL